MAITQIASCQQIEEKKYAIKAEAVDGSGEPISGINVITGRIEPLVGKEITLGKPVTTDAVRTNEQGIAMIHFKSIPEPSGNVNFYKEGWYPTSGRVIWRMSEDNRNQMQEADIKAVLRPIKNPIPMYASLMTGQKAIVIPEMNKEYGYDLERAALVAPLGEGKEADFTIKISGDNKSGSDAKITAVIRFPDGNDGLIYFETPNRDNGSWFLGDYKAPEGGYLNILEIPFDPSEMSKNMSRKNEGNYYLRTRTVRDASSKAVRSNYGKIHGDFMLWPLSMDQGGIAQVKWIESYFNPAPNDRNVEFDTKRNLNLDGNVLRP